MPTKCKSTLTAIDQEQFHAIDKVIMGYIFDIHNTLGRFCDESIYQEELSQRCRIGGLNVQNEVLLQISHKDFSKSYYVDMLIDNGIIYELKAVKMLNGNHQKQLINYLLLGNLKHGKLINFRAKSVESRFVSTRLTHNNRITYSVIDNTFDKNDNSHWLQEVFLDLLTDWGVFLDTNLYRESILHFLNNPEMGIQPVNIIVNDRVVGRQKMCLLDDETAWHLSAIENHLQSYETHITKLLNHTPLKKIHWINMNHNTIVFKTIKK